MIHNFIAFKYRNDKQTDFYIYLVGLDNPYRRAIYDCPDRYGLDGVQTVTYVCHGLDDYPGQSRIGHPNRDLDWMVLESVQSKSRIGRPIRDKPGRPSNPSHGLDVQSVTGLDDCPTHDIRMSRVGRAIQVTVWTSNP